MKFILLISILLLSGCVSYPFRPDEPGPCRILECPHVGDCSKEAALALNCARMVPHCEREETP
jgi:hypothetical protein